MSFAMQPAGSGPAIFILALVIAASPAAADNQDHDAHESHAGHEAHAEHGTDDPHGHDSHLAVTEHLRVLHGWTRATEQDHASVFMDIENIGDEPVRVTGGRSPIASTINLVGFSMVDGEEQYEALDGVPVLPGRELALAPRALALALEGLNSPLSEGAEFPLVLTTDHGPIEMMIAVEAADAQQHSHAGHAH